MDRHYQGKGHLMKEKKQKTKKQKTQKQKAKKQKAKKQMRPHNARTPSSKLVFYENSSSYHARGSKVSKKGRQSGPKFHRRKGFRYFTDYEADSYLQQAVGHPSDGQVAPELLETVMHSRSGQDNPPVLGRLDSGRVDPPPPPVLGRLNSSRVDLPPPPVLGRLNSGPVDLPPPPVLRRMTSDRTDFVPQVMSSPAESYPVKVNAEEYVAPPAVKRCKVEDASRSTSGPKMMSAQPSGMLEMVPSKEVTRMQLALKLTVQEDGLRKRATDLDAQIEKQREAFNTMRRCIEQLEAQKANVKCEEQAVKERRMQIIKESYASSTPSPTKTTEPTMLDPSGPCSSSSIRSITNDEVVGTVPIVVEIDDDDDEEEEEAPSITGSITAKVRERAMSQIESGSMSFGDLDSFVSSLMNEPNCDGECGREREITNVQSGAGEQAVMESPRTPVVDESGPETIILIDDDSPSVETPKGAAAKKKKKRCDGGQARTTPPKVAVRQILASPGSIEAHYGEVHQVRLFKGHLFSCGSDGRIQCFDPRDHKSLMEYCVCQDAVENIFLTDKPNGKAKIISSGGSVMFIHDMRSGEELQRTPMDAPITSMTISLFTVFLGLADGVIVTYDLRKNRVIYSGKVFSGKSRKITSLQTSSDGNQKLLIAATRNGEISVMKAKRYQEMRAIGHVHRTSDNFQIQSIDGTIYAIGTKSVVELSINETHPKAVLCRKTDSSIKRYRTQAICTQATSIITHKKRLVIVGCKDGSVRLMDVSQSSSGRMKVYYAPKRCSAIICLSCHIDEENKGLVVAGNSSGLIFLINVSFSEAVKECKVAGCLLDFEFDEDLVSHVMGDHILSADTSVVRCLWNDSCQYRYSKYEKREEVKLHIRSHF